MIAWSAELKIGFVDTQRIFSEAPAALKALKKIEQEFAKRDQELQALSRRLKSLQETIYKSSATMNETDRQAKENELLELSRNFKRQQRAFQEDLSVRQNEENSMIIEQANKTIRAIAKDEKFDLILQDVVWIAPRLDLTDRVIKTLSNNSNE